MTACFISDIHLDPTRPQVTTLLLDYLSRLPATTGSLFVLGDLFEAWIGDDAADALGESVAAGFRSVADRGIPVRFMRGNRDFLLGRDYAARAGMKLLPDACVIGIGGVTTLLLHGDTLCTDDIEYQQFRQMVRSPEWTSRFLQNTVEQRLAFAQQARAASQAHQQGVDEAITDVNPAAVEAAFRRYGVRRIIHGHTHRPALHSTSVDGQICERIVLGDWYEQGSILLVDANGSARLESLPLEASAAS